MADYQTITRDELKEKIDNGEDMVLIDTLGDESYQRAHLPGAVSIDAHGDDFVERVEEHVGGDTDTKIVVYCASFECQLSPQAAQKLVDADFTNVIDYEGGLKDWAKGGYQFEGDEAAEMQEKLSQAEE